MIKTESAESKLTHMESLKKESSTLSGDILPTLQNDSVDRFSDDDIQFLKFHGVYQQDDRDLRKTGKKYIMMIRGRIPGGVMTPAQWITFDDLATNYANNTLRITTRQSIQFHGVVKNGLGPLIKKINEALLSTLAACGDVNRNVMAPPTPAFTPARALVFEDCVRVADALKPRTKAYHSIWLDGVQLNLQDNATREFTDPLYGKTYLPRKFKTAFAIPPLNDIDILTNDLGFIAVVENDELLGYNLAVGGGMGRTHNNQATYPRLADVLGFLQPENLVPVAKAVLTIHRDFGDRTDRKHARLKYVVEEKGVDWTRAEIENRSGVTLEAPREFTFSSTSDLYGWNKQVDGKWFLTLFVEAGRVKDAEGKSLKSGLREIAEKLSNIEYRLSANQNIILANVSGTDKPVIDEVLSRHGVKTENQASLLHSASMACPALPTCGLALAEAERFLPSLLDRIESICAEAGVADQEIIIRMTGCPNGCARPYMAELAFVGKGPGRYQIWLGGDIRGTRLNRVWRELVKDADIENELRPLISRYASERNDGERFGDWCNRTVLEEAAATP